GALGRLNTKLASRSENKLRELARVLGDWRLELLDADGYPPEEGATYYENALAKARHGVKFVDEGWVRGEDSGLEVEGRGGDPGLAPRHGPEARVCRRGHVHRSHSQALAQLPAVSPCLAPGHAL